jgi:hypothetical protein
MTQPQSAFRRAPRPLIGWGGVLLVIVCVFFVAALAFIATFALWRWANGEPVDMQGFAAVLTGATAAGTAVWSLVKQFMIGRTTQYVEEIRAGGGARPFSSTTPSSPEPSPAGGLVNDGAINPQ